jgi:hypothetical protein
MRRGRWFRPRLPLVAMLLTGTTATLCCCRAFIGEIDPLRVTAILQATSTRINQICGGLTAVGLAER